MDAPPALVARQWPAAPHISSPNRPPVNPRRRPVWANRCELGPLRSTSFHSTAERRLERRAVGVHVASWSACLARRGAVDARVRQIQGVAAARAEACAIRRARAWLGAPCAAAREAGVAGIHGGIAGVADAALTADDALRGHASVEQAQEVDAVRSLALAPRDARRYAVAILFAAREVLAVDVVLACRERRAATGVGALSALGIEGADGAPRCNGPRVVARPSAPTDDGRNVDSQPRGPSNRRGLAGGARRDRTRGRSQPPEHARGRKPGEPRRVGTHLFNRSTGRIREHHCPSSRRHRSSESTPERVRKRRAARRPEVIGTRLEAA